MRKHGAALSGSFQLGRFLSLYILLPLAGLLVVIAAQERMRQAEATLHAHVDSGEHDPSWHRPFPEKK